MATTLNFNAIPDEVNSIKPGVHKCTIVECGKGMAKTGSLMFNIKLSIDDSDFTVFDNAVIAKADGSAVTFGQVKLKNIMKATNVIPQGDFTLDILPALLTGKSFMAELEKQPDSDYLQVKGINSYKPFVNPEVTPDPQATATVGAQVDAVLDQDDDI